MKSALHHRIPGTALDLRARHALAAAGVAVALLLGCWYLAFHDVAVARADANAYFAFVGLSQHSAVLAHLASSIANVCDTWPYVYLAAVPVIIALLRRRWTLAAAVSVMIPGAVASTELLKHVFLGPRPAVGIMATPISAVGSFPSGHSTAAMVLALAMVLASPSRWRPYVAIGGVVFALAVIYSVLTLGWHYPSDALGGILVAFTWTLGAVAAVLVMDARFGRDLGHLAGDRDHWLNHMPSIGAMTAAGAIPLLAVLVWRGGEVLRYAGNHSSFVAATIGVAVLGVAAPTALTALLSGSDRAATVARPHRLPPG